MRRRGFCWRIVRWAPAGGAPDAVLRGGLIAVRILWLTVLLGACATVPAEPRFPVAPERFITQFRGAEGLTFNGSGQLFIGANNAVWLAQHDGTVRRLVDVHRHLGQAGIGARDILAADFGPTNAFQQPGPNDDGMVWRITPEGERTLFATGIGDPNAILRLPDGAWLVSDDAVDIIYRVPAEGGRAEIWSRAVPFPNGMALSRDGRKLYVAQIFSAIGPVVPANAIWEIPIADGRPAGEARIVARTERAPDGLAADEHGRIYIADNGSGTIRRFDPATGEQVVIASGMPNVASPVFGEGRFDHYSLYATSTERGGGTIWRIRVGARGARPHP
ncbi:MAG TPA: SMP-30/gluconolactonase/LRE family protein [Allosphingosinicella sp.]|nr:SMP-30/gluconolactonase/LRE family protein [Allosphingosinicella sp.]